MKSMAGRLLEKLNNRLYESINITPYSEIEGIYVNKVSNYPYKDNCIVLTAINLEYESDKAARFMDNIRSILDRLDVDFEIKLIAPEKSSNYGFIFIEPHDIRGFRTYNYMSGPGISAYSFINNNTGKRISISNPKESIKTTDDNGNAVEYKWETR